MALHFHDRIWTTMYNCSRKNQRPFLFGRMQTFRDEMAFHIVNIIKTINDFFYNY